MIFYQTRKPLSPPSLSVSISRNPFPIRLLNYAVGKKWVTNFSGDSKENAKCFKTINYTFLKPAKADI